MGNGWRLWIIHQHRSEMTRADDASAVNHVMFTSEQICNAGNVYLVLKYLIISKYWV